jgi:hypothetical protein
MAGIVRFRTGRPRFGQSISTLKSALERGYVACETAGWAGYMKNVGLYASNSVAGRVT